MLENTCWFCGETIQFSDVNAVKITLENLMCDSDASQTIASHAECAKMRFSGATMEFDPEILAC